MRRLLMSSATWPTFCRSMPRTVSRVGFSATISTPDGDVVDDRPGIAQADLELALVDLGLVADADDLELLDVAFADADDGVVGQGPAEAVVGPPGLGFVGPAQDEACPLQGGRDARLERRRELAFLALEVDPVRMHGDGHARRQRRSVSSRLSTWCSLPAYQMLQRTSPPAPCSSQALPVMTPRDVETTTTPRPSRTLGTESRVQ